MKSICNKIWNFLDFLILKNFSKFLENSREISLLDLDLEAFSIHFSLSISILRHFHFTFHSRSRYQGIFISLFILEMSEPDFHFTFHFSKWVNQISISLFTSRTSNIYSRRTLQQCFDKSSPRSGKGELVWFNIRRVNFENLVDGKNMARRAPFWYVEPCICPLFVYIMW